PGAGQAPTSRSGGAPPMPVRGWRASGRASATTPWCPSVLRLLLTIRVLQRQHPIKQLLGIELAYQFLTDLCADLLEAGGFFFSHWDGLNAAGGLQERQCLRLILPHIRNRLGVVLMHGLAHQGLLLGGKLLP